MIKLVLLLCLLINEAEFATVSIMKVTACSNTTIQVRTNLCSEPCEVKRGALGSFEVDFEAAADSSKLTAEVTIRIGTLDVPYPDLDTNSCNDHGISCPIKKGNKYTYKYDMRVLPEYPKVKSEFKWIVKDANGNSDICFTMPISLID